MTKRDTFIGPAVAAATCTLLGSTAPSVAAAGEADRWDLDTALLYYGEDGDRVRDLSASVMTRRDFDDDRYLSLDLSVDSLTGASPSGAIATGAAQTFHSRLRACTRCRRVRASPPSTITRISARTSASRATSTSATRR